MYSPSSQQLLSPRQGELMCAKSSVRRGEPWAWSAVPRFNSAGLCLRYVIPKSTANVWLGAGFLFVHGVSGSASAPDPLCKG